MRCLRKTLLLYLFSEDINKEIGLCDPYMALAFLLALWVMCPTIALPHPPGSRKLITSFPAAQEKFYQTYFDPPGHGDSDCAFKNYLQCLWKKGG
jgi:hypothetical protein